MVTLQDVNFAESSLMELLQLKGYGDLLVALKIAEENITRRIEATNGEWTRKKLNEIRKQINIEISKAYGGLFDSVAEESVKVAEVTASAVAGVASFKLPKSTVEEILNPNRLIQGYGFKDLFQLTEENTARQLRVVVASGVSQGLTPNQIVSQYKVKSESLSRGQVVSNIRTNVADARLIGRHKAYEQLEATGAIRGYEYSATLDSHTCIAKGQKVNLSDGRSKNIEDIKPNDYIITHTGKKARVKFSEKTGFKKVVKIKLSDGRELIATEDHKLWDGKKWVTIKDLIKVSYNKT